MVRANTKAYRMSKFMADNPTATIEAVAKKFRVTKDYVYVIRSKYKARMMASESSNKVSEVSKKLSNKMKSLSVVTTDKPLSDMVDHPPHYKAGGVETIDFIEAKGLGYHLGNAVKYISRAGLKGTNNGMEDLLKARWYLNRAIEKNEFPNPTR